VDSDVHLLVNEDLDAVVPPLLDRLTRLQSIAGVTTAATPSRARTR
jgi:hypothetical protein